MQAVIVEDSPGWAMHLQLSGWLAHEWANASEEQRKLWDTNKGTLWRWSIKEGGDLYFKSGKDACMSSNLKKKKNICTYFWIVTGKSFMRSSKMVEKERSIVVMIIKNQFWSWNKREDGMNPTIREIPKKWKDQPCNREASSFQPLQSGNTEFSKPMIGN